MGIAGRTAVGRAAAARRTEREDLDPYGSYFLVVKGGNPYETCHLDWHNARTLTPST